MRISKRRLFSEVFKGFRTALVWAWPEEEGVTDKEWSKQSTLKIGRFVHDFVKDNQKTLLAILDDHNSEYFRRPLSKIY